MNTKKDYLVAIVAGFVTAIFLLPSLKNIQIGGVGLKIALPIIVPILWIVGLWLGKFLSRFLVVFYQLAKFAIVGFLNTAIDFGVLNLISILTGLTSGFLIGGVNIPGFILASVNSYFWNKFWVFRRPSEALLARRSLGVAGAKEEGAKIDFSDFFTFALVVIVGVFINGGIVVLLTTFVSPLAGLSPERWLNVAKVFATAVYLVWNFLGFKFLVFKK